MGVPLDPFVELNRLPASEAQKLMLRLREPGVCPSHRLPGGDIKIYSVVGVGTTFVVQLPRHDPSERLQ